MRKQAFFNLFWGLIFVGLDVSISGLDLLPDFIGYWLMVRGLGRLRGEHTCFRRARPCAMALVVLSLVTMVPLPEGVQDWPSFRREVRAAVTGDLGLLLPRSVRFDLQPVSISPGKYGESVVTHGQRVKAETKLVRITSEADAVNENRTGNPPSARDRVLGEYQDGTVVLILRYRSAEEAKSAVERKYESDDYMESPFAGAPRMSAGSSSEDSLCYRRRQIEMDDGGRVHLWWVAGWHWLRPSTWSCSGGFLSDRLLYIVEGRKESADAFRQALESKRPEDKGGGTVSFTGALSVGPLMPVAILRTVLDLLVIWLTCAGIAALALVAENRRLALIANWRKWAYAAVAVALWLLPPVVSLTTNFDAQAFLAGTGIVVGLVVAMALALLLVTGLMRRAAYTLTERPVAGDSAVATSDSTAPPP